MAHSLSFLLSSEAANLRAASRKPAFVVHVEKTSDLSVADRFVELDAESVDHASNLADAWVNKMGNASAAIRRASSDGSLHKISWIV